MKYNLTREEVIEVAQHMVKTSKSEESKLHISTIITMLQSSTDGSRADHFIKVPITVD